MNTPLPHKNDLGSDKDFQKELLNLIKAWRKLPRDVRIRTAAQLYKAWGEGKNPSLPGVGIPETVEDLAEIMKLSLMNPEWLLLMLGYAFDKGWMGADSLFPYLDMNNDIDLDIDDAREDLRMDDLDRRARAAEAIRRRRLRNQLRNQGIAEFGSINTSPRPGGNYDPQAVTRSVVVVAGVDPNGFTQEQVELYTLAHGYHFDPISGGGGLVNVMTDVTSFPPTNPALRRPLIPRNSSISSRNVGVILPKKRLL